mmetsp:Transcript_121328/g.329373  ORF Transcript_121328/g.329373 Transcript_121328/m.329373 type:complete len:232 (+) Transcript_121328:100-795(+)
MDVLRRRHDRRQKRGRRLRLQVLAQRAKRTMGWPQRRERRQGRRRVHQMRPKKVQPVQSKRPGCTPRSRRWGRWRAEDEDWPRRKAHLRRRPPRDRGVRAGRVAGRDHEWPLRPGREQGEAGHPRGYRRPPPGGRALQGGPDVIGGPRWRRRPRERGLQDRQGSRAVDPGVWREGCLPLGRVRAEARRRRGHHRGSERREDVPAVLPDAQGGKDCRLPLHHGSPQPGHLPP